jgi:MFS family permease
MNARTEAIAMLLVPGAIGGALGLLLVGRLFERRQARTLMMMSLLSISIGLIAFAALDYGVQSFVYVSTNYQITVIAPSLSTSIIVGAPAAFLIGFGITSALVSSRTVLTATAPIGQQARIFAAQGWMTDTILILPLLFAGIGTEMAGARPMLAGIGVLGLTVLVVLEFVAPRRHGLPAIGRAVREATEAAPASAPASEGMPAA